MKGLFQTHLTSSQKSTIQDRIPAETSAASVLTTRTPPKSAFLGQAFFCEQRFRHNTLFENSIALYFENQPSIAPRIRLTQPGSFRQSIFRSGRHQIFGIHHCGFKNKKRPKFLLDARYNPQVVNLILVGDERLELPTFAV